MSHRRQPKLTFQLGDQVSWQFYEDNPASYKSGAIAHIVPAGHPILAQAYRDAFTQLLTQLNASWTRQFYLESARDHESYLVLIPYTGSSTRAKHRLYWPRVGQLRPINAGAMR